MNDNIRILYICNFLKIGLNNLNFFLNIYYEKDFYYTIIKTKNFILLLI